MQAARVLREAAAKLHAVTMVRSPIGREQKVRDALKALGLRKMNQTVVHKNTPTINGQIQAALVCVDVRPVVFAPGAPSAEANSRSGVFVGSDYVVRGASEADLLKEA